MTSDRFSLESLAAHGFCTPDARTGAITPGVHPATTYLREPDNSDRDGRVYTRADNPTYDGVEAALATLEGGAGAFVFASGMAAATAVFKALSPGDHVIAPTVMYWALRLWLEEDAPKRGLEVDLIDPRDLDALEAALRPGRTKLVWIETPANPLWHVTDIRAAADLAHGVGAKLAVDSTAATPVLSRPIEYGADLVMHSATKYLNGHSDVLAGALITAAQDPHWDAIRSVRALDGGVLGPFEAWLLQRGMRTLFLRVARASESAMAIAEAMAAHPLVSDVLYPGLPNDPGHAIAQRQMSGFGGMLSIRVAGGEQAAIATAAAVRLWVRATSLGGVESLIEHRSSREGPSSPVPSDLLRLSVGIERAEDLIADLDQALRAAAT